MDSDLSDYLLKFNLRDKLDHVGEIWEDKAYTFCKEVKPNMVVLDVGSLFGSFAHYVVAKGAKKVYAIEACAKDEETQRMYIWKTDTFDRIISLHLALWRKNGVVHLNPYSRRVDSVGEKVRALTIDQLMIDLAIGKVDFIKIDTEGGELPIIYGAKNTIRKMHPILAIASYHSNFYDVSGKQLINQKTCLQLDAIIEYMGHVFPEYSCCILPNKDDPTSTFYVE